MSEFNIKGDRLLHYSGNEKIYVVPKDVKVIGSEAFANNQNLITVILPDKTIEIKDKAFAKCSNLEKIEMSENVKYIGDEAFAECENLKEVVFRKSTKILKIRKYVDDILRVSDNSDNYKIADKAFSGCISLREICLPAKITEIGDNAFSHCSSLESVKLPFNLKLIGIRAFEHCVSLKEMLFPKNLESIFPFAFEGCYNIKELNMPSDMRYLGYNCLPPQLDRFVLPDMHSDWTDRAFDARLIDPDTRIEIGKLYIEGKAFLSPAIEEYTRKNIMKEKYVYIDWIAKSDNAALMTQFLSLWKKPTLKMLDDILSRSQAMGSPSVAAIAMERKNKDFPPERLEELEKIKTDKALGLRERTVRDWREIFELRITNSEAYIIGYKGNDSDVLVPGKIGKYPVIEICPYAFYGSEFLHSVKIEEGVKFIAGDAFSECRNLVSVILPKSVFIIGMRVFSKCNKNLVITAPKGSYGLSYAKERYIRTNEI